jgi:ribosomal protein S18 acetylase RimI-like enzyme
LLLQGFSAAPSSGIRTPATATGEDSLRIPNIPGPLSTAHPRPRDPSDAPVRLVRHGRLCLRLRWRLAALGALLDGHSFWATGRRPSQLGRMLSGSQVVVSAWQGSTLVGFGRATSDGVFRAVLWDVVVAEDQQGVGVGRRLVEALLASPEVAAAERIYLMTTTGEGFYEKMGFSRVDSQRLMLKQTSG